MLSWIENESKKRADVQSNIHDLSGHLDPESMYEKNCIMYVFNALICEMIPLVVLSLNTM